MSVVLMKGKDHRWLRLGRRECPILDAMVSWARATTKTSPERIQVMEDGDKYIVSGGEDPFHVSGYDGGLPGIGWGSMDYWAVRTGEAGDWQLLFEADRQVSAMEEVYWATNELHSTNMAHGIAPAATKGHKYKDVEALWREIGIPDNLVDGGNDDRLG